MPEQWKRLLDGGIEVQALFLVPVLSGIVEHLLAELGCALCRMFDFVLDADEALVRAVHGEVASVPVFDVDRIGQAVVVKCVFIEHEGWRQRGMQKIGTSTGLVDGLAMDRVPPCIKDRLVDQSCHIPNAHYVFLDLFLPIQKRFRFGILIMDRSNEIY